MWRNLKSVAGSILILAAAGNVGSKRVLADGLDTWFVRNSGTTADLRSITYGNGLFLVGGRGTILRSTNGTDWLPSTTVFPQADGGGPIVFATVGTGSGIFVAADSSPGSYRIWKSTNGADWVTAAQGLIVAESIAFGNQTFVVGGCPNGENTVYSFDGASWRRGDGMTSFDYIKSVAFGNGRFVAGGYPFPTPTPDTHSGLWQSTNGIAWARIVEGTILNVVFGDGKFLINLDGAVAGSPDAPLAPDIVSVSQPVGAFGAGYFISNPSTNQILSRTVGGAWVPHSFPSNTIDQRAMVTNFWGYGQGTFVGVGSGGVIVQSGKLPPRFTSFKKSAGGDLVLAASLPGVQTVALESSTNLINWNVFKTLAVQDDQMQTNQTISAQQAGGTYYRFKVLR